MGYLVGRSRDCAEDIRIKCNFKFEVHVMISNYFCPTFPIFHRVMAHMVYILSGTCGEVWSEFSWKAFQNLRVVLGYFLHQLFCFEFSSRWSAWIPNLVKSISIVTF
ncbi:hypothetical protein POM88_006724 [Heracleum sosnowskyi]|uniref:Uncharacterized protein n=1 Tax=Heracleum sosnowskyi TaxID=360622 RepID=A0AAD8J418_9APIA|nr:hypothetical protein POM88_006724 [Heracleum sosnowskyi]